MSLVPYNVLVLNNSTVFFPNDEKQPGECKEIMLNEDEVMFLGTMDNRQKKVFVFLVLEAQKGVKGGYEFLQFILQFLIPQREVFYNLLDKMTQFG